ncbi:putative Ig domain-containing protein [Cylindrospermum sp. FACHB-282]|uniref:putative Ig domain-containing protein n=1 Tax=Cylindrospermum sp. FACHB-282 TaxID=2692794 RepID=UPI0016868EE2|nr:putative Ig domain-containing protein [Cylindrospermum sp. FACHB-282]MBD2386561.1 FG-GAP repeat protein [Cylindrospermum sp. FACHB-282]
MANSVFNLSDLNGVNGFVVNGITEGDFSGSSVSSAGDINGDGFDDLIIGARGASPNGTYSGQSYVVFGSSSGFSPTLNLSTLNGANGFAINGIAAYDQSGRSVSSAGDVNGDGFDDLIIGARYADPNGSNSGQSYVVFGSSSSFSPTLNLSTLNGANGFAINGIAQGDRSGSSVSSAGDVNGDGFDDLIIGARYADPNGSNSGQSYVVFGSSSGFSPTLNLSTLNGANGFTINGIAQGDSSGSSVSSAGDVNGDGFDDLIIGAPGADSSGQSYVVFGSSSGFSPTLNLSTLNGANGFTINGIPGSDLSGSSVSSAGDVNGDGFDDLIIGAPSADPNGSLSGQSYVVFGSSGFSPTLNLSSLNGANGFAINGIPRNSFPGISVSSAGDVNGDGFDDLIIGVRGASPSGMYSGQSYVVFGSSSGFSPTFNLSTLNGANGFTINGIPGSDFSGSSVSSAGDVNGDGFDDLMIGAPGYFRNRSDSGQTYVVFGYANIGAGGSSNLVGIDFSTTFTGTPVSIVDSDFTLTDNNAALAGATITITNLLDGAAESLGATAIGNITATYNATTGILTLSGTDTIANYRQVLASLTYNNTAASPNTTNRTIEFVVDDGQPFSNTSAVVRTTVAVSPSANQPPVAVDDAFSTNEDQVLNGNVLIANPTTADSDPNNDTLTVTQVNGNAAAVGNEITLNSGALLTLTSNGSFVYNPQGQFESLSVGATASDSFTYTIDDGNGGTSTATVNLTINGVNDAPTLVNALSDTTTTENSAFNFTFPANTFADIDVGDTLTYTATLDNDNPLPSWLSFNANTRTFSGTPAAGNVGTISVKLTAKDTSNANVSDIFNLTVTPLNLMGTPNADNLTGTASNNTIYGLAGNDTITGNQGDDTLIGRGDKDRFVFNLGDGTDTITDLGGIGKGSNPPPAVIAEIDILKFQGAGLTAGNLLLTKNGSNLEVSFENVANSPKVILQNFALENLDNLTGLGNILFDGETTITDSFDVFDADSTSTTVFNRNTVTFLNDLNNNVSGFNSADVINAQLGDDTIDGLGGDDLLRGGAGNDTLSGGNGDDKLYGDDGNDSLVGGNGQDLLVGGGGNDFLDGGRGDDNLTGGTGSDIFLLATAAGRDTITDFSLGQSDQIGLSGGLSFNQLSFSGNEISLGNQTLAALTGFDTTTLTQDNFVLV